MLRDLSYKYKIPLAFMAVILVTAVALASTMAVRAYDMARSELLANAERLGGVLANTLADAIRKDAVWEAYRSLERLSRGDDRTSGAPIVVVMDRTARVFVSNRPDQYPLLASASDAGLGVVESLTQNEDRFQGGKALAIEEASRGRLLMIVPIEISNMQVGVVVMIYPKSLLYPPLYEIVKRTPIITVLVLAALLPFAWYWGQRLAAPLVHLADSLAKVATIPPEEISLPEVNSLDELGRLTHQFRAMLKDLQEKRDVEKQMIVTERLAAIGRLAAGVAHEINNPLGGMLNSLNTYRQHGNRADLSEKTVSLLERGLQQIKETVSALLVEAKLETHPLCPEDIEDVRTLILPELHKKRARLRWASEVTAPAALPSTQVRQVLINLLLNALQAVEEGGEVSCNVMHTDKQLRIVVEDDGKPIPVDQIGSLFEPFAQNSVNGSGLGLWVTYQIVQQFHGEITVGSELGLTKFQVQLPIAS